MSAHVPTGAAKKRAPLVQRDRRKERLRGWTDGALDRSTFSPDLFAQAPKYDWRAYAVMLGWSQQPGAGERLQAYYAEYRRDRWLTSQR